MVIGITTLVSSKEITGLGKYIVHLIDGLQKVESEHKFIIFVNKDLDKKIEIYNPRFKKIVVKIPHNPRIIMRPFFFLWHNMWFGWLLKKYCIEILHIPNSIPLCNTWNIPSVVTIHDVGEYSIRKYTRIRQFLRKVASNSSSKRVNKIITVSESSKQEILKYLQVDSDLVIVTYLAPALDFRKVERIKSPLQTTPYFLHVGGNRLNKNLSRVTKAFTDLNTNIADKLISIGKDDTQLMSVDELQVFEKKGIYYKGYINEKDLIGHYKNALALIFPSIHEGFGLPIIEAMACGTPVISSNTTSMPEVGGDAIHYVNPNSVNSIKAGMEKIIEDQDYRKGLIKKGYVQVKRFSLEETAKKTIEVYEKAGKQR